MELVLTHHLRRREPYLQILRSLQNLRDALLRWKEQVEEIGPSSSKSFWLAWEPDSTQHLLRLVFSSLLHAPFSFGDVQLERRASSSPLDNLRECEEKLGEDSKADTVHDWLPCTLARIAYSIEMEG